MVAQGVEGEARNITPTVAFFIGAGLAEMLAKRESVPTTSLRISVGASCPAPGSTSAFNVIMQLNVRILLCRNGLVSVA